MEFIKAESKADVLDDQGYGVFAYGGPSSRLASSKDAYVRDSKAKFGIGVCHSDCGGVVR